MIEELIIKNGEKEIYGKLYCPEGDSKFPAVILSHGYNGAHSDFKRECEFFAKNGYIAYAYDFCGGSTRSKSSGKSTDMTIFTEKEDLLAVFDYISAMPETDTSRVYLFGASQGGLVTTLATEERTDKVKGVILYFPALNIPDDWRRNYASVDDIPNTNDFWGLKLGKNFFVSMHEFDTFENIGKFQNNVLIIHGDKDNIVPLSYSEKSITVYPNAALIVLPGEGHGYSAAGGQTAMEKALEFMQTDKLPETDTNREFNDVPREYLRKCETGGTLTKITYASNSYDTKNLELQKEALVYLPYGYDTDTKDYNVFYYMHGGGDNAEGFFGGVEGKTSLKNILDNMIANGDIEPLIVVTPTFYYEGTTEALTSVTAAAKLTQNFHHEFVNDLIPAIEGQFRAKSGREHRAFGGFSVGSEATWNIFAKCLKEVKYFLPMSGDCWAITVQGGNSRTKETVQYLIDAVKNSGVARNDYAVFACTGDKDIAYDAMNKMLTEMKKHPEYFDFATDFTGGNFVYCLAPGGVHANDYNSKYVFNALPHFFK